MKLVERIKITVRASGAHPDVLTVQDAMQQVLDIFRLLTANGDAAVEWKLTAASTNSPFHLEGEAVSLKNTSVDISVVARAQKAVFASGIDAYQRGEIFQEWSGAPAKIAEGMFKRNTNGVGQTNIDLGFDDPIVITPSRAEKALEALARKTDHELLYAFTPVQEHGAFDGVLEELKSHHNYPSVSVVERKTGRTVWCHLSSDLQARLQEKAEYNDFWRHQRVLVRGKITKNAQGQITLVDAYDIERLTPKQTAEAAIFDADFAAGLPIQEYLDRFRDGRLGDKG